MSNHRVTLRLPGAGGVQLPDRRFLRSSDDFGDRDALLLAIATEEPAYAFQVPSAIMSQADAGALQRDTIEPALRQGGWTGAAVAAANGLNTASTSTGAGSSWLGLLVALAVFALAILALWWWTRRRRRKRREACRSSPLPGGWTRRTRTRWPRCRSTHWTTFSKAIVVDVDNAVRTSDSDIGFGSR